MCNYHCLCQSKCRYLAEQNSSLALAVEFYTYFELVLPSCTWHDKVQMENVITPGYRVLYCEVWGFIREIALDRNKNKKASKDF